MEATLIYPHQLFEIHPAISLGREIWLIEDPLFFGNDPHWPSAMHRQKLMLHRATMKSYAAELATNGRVVNYIDSPQGNELSSSDLLEKYLPKNIKSIHYADVSDELLSRRITRFASKRDIGCFITPSPNFISPADFLATHIAGKKRPFMAKFYESQRKRTGTLLESDGTAQGGKWSFDTENRAKLPKNHLPPSEPFCTSNSFTQEAESYINEKFPENPGCLKNFRWPVTRNDSKIWLDQFIEDRLENFGLYEDAISVKHAYIYHAAITPMLNIGLLDPNDVIKKILARQHSVPMNSLEGFIRQIIGWREFMHGIYVHRGVEIRNGNFWNFTTPLPASFYTGETGIAPVDRVIKQLLTDGYCHHIERLMVLGNFMLLCRIKPDDVYRWFMEMFVDSYDWVMVPNVYGMSQFADGGTFTTKPYISGSNYVLKMSDEPKGDWCTIWDSLFWTFIADHQPFFLKNPRLSMMARLWQKQTPAKQAAHRKVADDFLLEISGLPEKIQPELTSIFHSFALEISFGALR
jgi:deoxyribodipyrimidine photolyase-related protein